MFDKQSILLRTSDGQNFILAETLSYTTEEEITNEGGSIPCGYIITCDVGSTTDGLSGCRIVKAVMDKDDLERSFLACVLHDHLYRDTVYSKPVCDALFYQALLVQGVNPVAAHAMYDAVTMFGQSSFDKDRAGLDAP